MSVEANKALVRRYIAKFMTIRRGGSGDVRGGGLDGRPRGSPPGLSPAPPTITLVQGSDERP